MEGIDYNSEEVLKAFDLVRNKLSRKDRYRFISNQMDFYIKEHCTYKPTEDDLNALFTTYKFLEKSIDSGKD